MKKINTNIKTSSIIIISLILALAVSVILNFSQHKSNLAHTSRGKVSSEIVGYNHIYVIEENTVIVFNSKNNNIVYWNKPEKNEGDYTLLFINDYYYQMFVKGDG